MKRLALLLSLVLVCCAHADQVRLAWDAADPATECTDCATQEPIPCNVPVDGYRIFYGADRDNLTSYFDAGDLLEITLELPQYVFVGAKSYRSDIDCDGSLLPEKLSDYSNIIYYAGPGDLLPATNLEVNQDCEINHMGATFINSTVADSYSDTSFVLDSLNIATGDLIVVWAKWEDADRSLSVTDTIGNTYSYGDKTNSGGGPYGQFAYVQSIGANDSNIITVNFGSATAYIRSIAMQFRPDSGETITLDDQDAAAGSGASVASGNITTTGTDEIVVAGFSEYNDVTSPSATINGEAASIIESNNTQAWYKVFTSTFTGNAAMTGNGSYPWVCSVIAFKSESGEPMAVELTGTPQYVTNTSHSNSSQAITIPADCTAVIVASWGWRNSYALGFSALNFDNSGLDFTQIVTNASTSDQYDVWAYIMTSASGNWPGTGAKTVYWTFNNAPTEGGSVVIFFVKGLDTSDAIRDTDSHKFSGTGGWTASLSGVQAGDLTFLIGVIYNDQSITGRGTGQTVLTSSANDNNVEWEISYEDGEGAPSWSTGPDSWSGYFDGAIAFALKAASGEPAAFQSAWARGSNVILQAGR